MTATVYTAENPHPALAQMRKIVTSMTDQQLRDAWKMAGRRKSDDAIYVRVVLAAELERRGL